jgi:transketolase
MSNSTNNDVEQLAVDTIRTLSMDAVQAANSGHPGTAMALAPVAYVLYDDVLRYDPAAPDWPNRDRFVLSCGHASMLLYSILHLVGVKQPDTGQPAVSLDDIRRFRQFGSRCPGHPELGHTAGVETTTGPLGQGIASSVGMAIASRHLAGQYNRPGFELFDFNVYALCSDGDLMEGISSEAASLAGHLKLANLCWIYDDNGITIEGKTELAFSENVAARFSGYGWSVVEVEDANDLDALRGALEYFRETDDRPTLVVVKSHIGWGSPNKQDTADAHGAPLGEDEVRRTKAAYGWPEDEHFRVPAEVLDHFRQGIGTRGEKLRRTWDAQLAEYAQKYPEPAKQLERMGRGELPDGWDAGIPSFPPDAKGVASRVSSGKVLNQVAKNVPWLVGGSADLAPSTKTLLEFDGAGEFRSDNYAGRNFHFGVREHAMAAVCNGMTLCGLRTYGATFFVFADYLRPAMRLAAMMGLPVLYIFTHDSIGVGEDGPTHQPVEQLAALRSEGRNSRRATFGRLCAGRRPRRQARRYSNRRRQRGVAVSGSPRHARRRGDQRPSCEPAQLGTVRGAAGRVSRVGVAAGRDRPGRRRDGRGTRLEQVRWPGRPVHRHDRFRRLRPLQRTARSLRLHPRRHRRPSKSGDSVVGRVRDPAD